MLGMKIRNFCMTVWKLRKVVIYVKLFGPSVYNDLLRVP